ncbi:hypothetical protein ACJ73_09924, partial [Blastomyces percursus]
MLIQAGRSVDPKVQIVPVIGRSSFGQVTGSIWSTGLQDDDPFSMAMVYGVEHHVHKVEWSLDNDIM